MSLLTVVLAGMSGLFFGNGIPHFVSGITRQSYPMVFGNAPVPNLLAGWSSLVVSAVLAYWADPGTHLQVSAIAFAIGVLLIGLFHSGPGAFGQPGER